MKNPDVKDCKVNVFVCTNEKVPEKACCKKVGGQELFQNLKQTVRDRGLAGTHWVTRTGCLGFCNDVGGVVGIFRRGEEPKYFSEVKAEDFNTILEEVTR